MVAKPAFSINCLREAVRLPERIVSWFFFTTAVG
jgi:hypothetical protein